MSRDVAAGLVLVLLGVAAFFLSHDLSPGHLASMGAGMMPKTLAVAVIAVGGAILLASWRRTGPGLEGWSFRGPFFVLGAFLVFGLTIQSLGLLVAGPSTVITAGLAMPDSRPKELLATAVGLTAFCIVLFKLLLQLPIRLAPWALGY